LPQLPLQSTKALVDRHLAVEVVDIVAGPLLFDMITHLLVLDVAPPMPSICLP
jgi:hypothetical protein